MEKGLATKTEVDKALEHQKKGFKRAKIRKLIGGILVDAQVITIKQKNTILIFESMKSVFTDKSAGSGVCKR